MYLLGFNCYVFNSAACLLKDGELIAAAQEERFTREKNTGEFPTHAIAYCLQEAGITIDDVDHACFHWRPFHQFHRRIGLIVRYLPDSVRYWGSHSSRWSHMVRAESALREAFPGKNGRSKFAFHRVKHHVCHASSAFLVSPFEEAAILTLDGSGEMAATTFGIGKGSDVQLIREIFYPNSLGYLYVSLTHYLGFTPDRDEYKVMGLAPYGTPDLVKDFEDVLRATDDGGYQVNLDYFNYQRGIRTPWVSQKFVDRFGPVRQQGEPLLQRHKDLAFALQHAVEEVILHLARHAHRITGMKNLCLAGGVALNSVTNGRLLRESPFEHIFVQPAANDAGTGIGSAAYTYHKTLGYPRHFAMQHALYGPAYSQDACLAALHNANAAGHALKWQELSEDDLVQKTAELLADGKIVGWFQGRMELGPRALGQRSILADPRRAEMKDILNSRVKHREAFRPFAPSVLEEHASEYFECDVPSNNMLYVFPVRADKQDVIPAVTHVDGTARVQTVNREQQPLYWKLIRAFGDKTGVPVLINTSLNVMGEPIICAPPEAVNALVTTGLDYLAMGNLLVSK